MNMSWMVTDEEMVQRFKDQQNVVPASAPYLMSNLRSLTVCHECHELKGDIRLYTGKIVQQACSCNYEKDSHWKHDIGTDWDFNRAYETCYCCGLEIIPTGSKWSLFFCQDCKAMIMELNNTIGTCVIPIGRHSVMNGVTRPLQDNNKAIAKVVSDINNMNSAIDLLGSHKQYILDKQLKRFNVDESDSIITLVENSNNARLRELKLEAFNEILQFRRTGEGPQLAFDSGHNLEKEPIAPPAPPLRPNEANGGIQENPFEISSKKCPVDSSHLIFNSIVSHWFCPKCRKAWSEEDLSLKRGNGWPKGCLVYFVIFALLIAWLLIWGKP